ncbi:secretin N-terminal domain-containing protein [Salicola sp. Rm-C-2C1-2]|uniref:secretin N-terminal domain-containing protein n=1 Tax=Salicola sp. Rm-C-2C1-2 TaxID=3141321 RepID=UPI0032E469FF
MKPAIRNLILIGLLLFLAMPGAFAATESHVFELENRRAQTVVPQLRNLYGDEITLSPDGQNLMVRAKPEQLAEIKSLLSQIDQPVRRMRLALRHREMASGEDDRTGSERVYSTQRASTRSLVVQDQQIAQISSGRIARLPVAARGGKDPMVIVEEVAMTSGFLVRPSVLSDDQVELHITAIRNEPIPGKPGYETAGVVTIRRVTPGEWVELGKERRSARSQNNSRVHSTQSKGNRLWEVKIEVLPAP